MMKYKRLIYILIAVIMLAVNFQISFALEYFTVPLYNVQGGVVNVRVKEGRIYYGNEHNYTLNWGNVTNNSISWTDEPTTGYDEYYYIFGFCDLSIANSIVREGSGLALTGSIELNTTGHLSNSPYIMKTRSFSTFAELGSYLSGGVRWYLQPIITPTPTPTPTPYPTYSVGEAVTPIPGSSGSAQLPEVEEGILNTGGLRDVISWIWETGFGGWGLILIIALIAAGIIRLILMS